MQKIFLILLAGLFLSLGLYAQKKDSIKLAKEKQLLSNINPYDTGRDPSKDLEYAIGEAQKNNKRILLQVGGNWCIWCKRLEKFISENRNLYSTLHSNFILIKVNYSKENKNEEFLSKFPKVPGYPHIFVLEKDGTLLLSKNTSELEKEDGYDKDKLMTFFETWKPAEEN